MKSTITALAFGIALALTPNMANATSLAPLTDVQMVDASTYVVKGTIDRVWVEADESGTIWTRAQLVVDTTYKGPDDPETIIIDTLGGRLDGTQLYVEGAAQFSAGESVMVFLGAISHGTRWSPVAMNLGKYTLRRAPGDTLLHVNRFTTRRTAHYDHRFIPHVPLERRVYLQDVIATIEERLQTGWDGKAIPGISMQELTELNTPALRRIQ